MKLHIHNFVMQDFERFSESLDDMLKASEIQEANSEDVISVIRRMQEVRRKKWNSFFEKYSNIELQESIPIKDIPLYYSDDFLELDEKSTTDINKLEKKSEIEGQPSTSTTSNLFRSNHFLSDWTNIDEIRYMYREFKHEKVNLLRLRKLIELTLNSSLKDLLVLREEARILKLRKFDEYDRAAKKEVRRLIKYIGKKYVVMYILLYKSDIPLDKLKRLMEEKYKSKLYILLNMPNKSTKTLAREWNRLKKFMPADYLVEYCETMQLNYAIQKRS